VLLADATDDQMTIFGYLNFEVWNVLFMSTIRYPEKKEKESY
jgi:hypothetical protein